MSRNNSTKFELKRRRFDSQKVADGPGLCHGRSAVPQLNKQPLLGFGFRTKIDQNSTKLDETVGNILKHIMNLFPKDQLKKLSN